MKEEALNKETGPVDGKNGLYVYTSLLPSAADALLHRLQYIDIMLSPEAVPSLHCTIMYSKASVQGIVKDDPSRRFSANSLFFDYWDGHDNEGYLILRLGDCSSLRREHEYWKERGAVPTFEPYEPHITILEGEEAKQRQDMKGKRFMISILMLGVFTENLKE